MMTITRELFQPAALTCTYLPSSFRCGYRVKALCLGACSVVAPQSISARIVSFELQRVMPITNCERDDEKASDAEHSRSSCFVDQLLQMNARIGDATFYSYL